MAGAGWPDELAGGLVTFVLNRNIAITGDVIELVCTVAVGVREPNRGAHRVLKFDACITDVMTRSGLTDGSRESNLQRFLAET